MAGLCLALVGMAGISAQEPAPAAPPQEEAEAKPPELELNTAEFVALQKEYRESRQGVVGPHREALDAFVEKHLAAANGMYEEGKRAGNTRSMGTARDYQRIFNTAKEKLAESGDFELPKKVRRELEEIIANAVKEKAEVDEPIAPKLKEIEDGTLARFHELVKARAVALEVEYPPELVTAKLEEFRTKDLVVKAPAKRPGADPGQGPGTTPADETGPIIAVFGQGVRWVTIGRWTGEMMGTDVIDFKCVDQRDFAEDRFSPMGGNSKTQYKSVKPMPPHPGYSYRLKRIPEHHGVEQVMEWPSAKNGWKLLFRIRIVGDMIPEKHGFDLEVSLPEAELVRLFGAEAAKADTPELTAATQGKSDGSKPGPALDEGGDAGKIGIRILTKPLGVNVYINGVLQVDRKTRKPIVTPCEAKALPGNHAIRLEKAGYLAKEFKEFLVQPGKRIVWELLPDPNKLMKEVAVRATQEDWLGTGLIVKPGAEVVIRADGEWSCGNKRDLCGPEGLPNDQRYYKYYAKSEEDVRQNFTIPYGALMIRIGGGDGEILTIRPGSSSLTFKPEVEGELMFDINEQPGKERKNNTGKLDVTVIVPAT